MSDSLQPHRLAHQTPMSMGILQTRILEWAVMPPAGDFPNQGIEPESLTSPALAGEFFTTSTTWEEQSERRMPFYIERDADPFY